MASPYKLHRCMEATDSGVPVRLQLQQRVDVPPCELFTMSWRTTYPGSASNRRFYFVKGAVWTVAAEAARALLERADAAGLLAPMYDDSYVRFGGGEPSFITSTTLPRASFLGMWREITRQGYEIDWGDDPLFLVAEEPGERWRKVLIVDTTRTIVTFRSCTTEAGYALKLRNPSSATWYMDNSMQDAGTAITRRFLELMRQHRVG